MLKRHKIGLLITILIIATAGFTAYATTPRRIYNYTVRAIEYGYAEYFPIQYAKYLNPTEAYLPASFYMWVIDGAPGGPIVVDMGFEPWGAWPGIEYTSPAEALEAAGIDPAEVKTVIITHMHFDHVGVCYEPSEFPFPNAEFYIQADEWHAYMDTVPQDPWLKGNFYCFDPDWYEMEAAVWSTLYSEDRVKLVHAKTYTIVPGVRVMRTGGHTAGHQVVVVSTREGDVVIAGDLILYYWNLDEPTGMIWNLEEQRVGAHRIQELATSGVIFPGHDPAGPEIYPPP